MDTCYDHSPKRAAEKQKPGMTMGGQIVVPRSPKIKGNYKIICDELTVR